MKAIVGLILSIALFISRSTTVVHAFHLKPHRVGITTRVNSGYQQLPKTVITHDKYDDNAIGGSQFPRLFTLSSGHNLDKKPGRIRRLFRTFSSILRCSKIISRRFRTLVASVALLFMINLSVLPAWAAPSSGRMGGSFDRSSRYRSPPISRNIRRSNYGGSNYGVRVRAPTRTMYPPHRLNGNRSYQNFHQANGEQVAGDGVSVMTSPDGSISYARKINTHPFANSPYSAGDVVLVAGVTAVVTNGIVKRKSDREKYDDDDLSLYPLGPGISVWCMTVCLNVPNLNDPMSIVSRLRRLAETTSTKTRKGLQSILADTSLELLRQLDKGSIASVESQCDHYRSSDQAVVRAKRQYNRISTRERSKFEKESLSSYNGSVVRDDNEEPLSSYSEGTSSFALVQIHVVIEGDVMRPFGQRQMESKKSFRKALEQLSGDVTAVEDCVVAGEVLWAPQQQVQHQAMTEEDVYASYPTLWPVNYSIV
jgi:uncharacterized membrane protein